MTHFITHLLLFPERKKTNTRYLHNLEADTGNITLGLTATTKTRNEDFVVLVDEVEATIILLSNPISAHPQHRTTWGRKTVYARARKR